jgi:uncharacterized protein YjlB
MSIQCPCGVLGVFGGEGGVVLEVPTRDVVGIPAGVAHRNLGSNGYFRPVGVTGPLLSLWRVNP